MLEPSHGRRVLLAAILAACCLVGPVADAPARERGSAPKRIKPGKQRAGNDAKRPSRRRCRHIPRARRCANRGKPDGRRRDAVRPDFFGVSAEQAYALTGAGRQAILDQIAATRIATIRQVLHWSHIERLPGRYDFSYTDRYVADVARHGISIMAVLFDPPAFRTRAPLGAVGLQNFPPSSNAEFAAFAATLARRYGSAGSFWRENPDLPRRPIVMWQVWNEPSIAVNWPTGVSPEGYAEMLTAVGSALHRADPAAEVITAGLPESRLAMPLERFVTRMYAGGGQQFDSLGLNAYANDAQGVLEIVRRMRLLMDALGPDGRPIRISEFGWATGGAGPHRLNTGLAGQATRIREAYPLLASARKRLGLRSAYLWNWMDLPPAEGQAPYWGNHAGLVDKDGNEKPGLGALRETIQPLLG